MRLNLTVLADALSDLAVTSLHAGNAYDLSLVRASLWHHGEDPRADTVYVVRSSDLPPVVAGRPLSLVCLGTLPDAYRQSPRVSFVELAQTEDLQTVLQTLWDTFSHLSDWDSRLTTACLTRTSIDAIAAIAWEPFENNFCCYDAQNYLLFFEHRPDDPYVAYYPDQHTYLSAEGRNELVGNADYELAFTSRVPVVMHDSSQATDSIVCNLFDGNTVFARLTLDQTQRSFLPSDFTLLWHVGTVLREVLLQWNLLRVGTSLAFDAMIEDLVERGSTFSSDHERVLGDAGWSLDDVYRCMVIVPREGVFAESSVSQGALFVQRHLENVYTSGNVQRLLVVVNAGKRRGLPEPDQELMDFLSANDYLCSISREFRGFDRVATFFKQAWETLRAGRSREGAGPVFSFDEYALDIMLSNATGGFAPTDYVIPQLHAIETYDREHDADLMRTLVTYIRGAMNVTATVSRLHVHKTTFYYRLRRIEEISGLSLDDYRTVLYLMMVFEMRDDFRSLSLA